MRSSLLPWYHHHLVRNERVEQHMYKHTWHIRTSYSPFYTYIWVNKTQRTEDTATMMTSEKFTNDLSIHWYRDPFKIYLLRSNYYLDLDVSRLIMRKVIVRDLFFQFRSSASAHPHRWRYMTCTILASIIYIYIYIYIWVIPY